MMKKFFSEEGQGLLEAVFAIGILLITSGAILALAVSNVVGQKASEFQVRANNLAREGIEAVRSIRDSNWLAGDDWDSGLQGDRAVFDDTTNSWSLDSITEKEIKLNVITGVHSHNPSGSAVVIISTVFSRSLLIEEICEDDANGAESIEVACISGQSKIGIKVSVTVSWLERDENKDIQLIDLLYDWK